MAARPMGRISLSEKRIAMPCLLPSSTSRLPSVSATPMRSSSSRSTMAMRPVERRLANSVVSVRLMRPLRVAMTR